jgi:hypothetical protein
MNEMYKLTEEQANELRGLQYASNCYFNPIQDVNDEWFICEIEVNKSNIAWVKELQPSSFEPKIIDLPNV